MRSVMSVITQYSIIFARHFYVNLQINSVAKRPRDASCLYSFNTKRLAQSFIISCFGFRYTTAYN